MSDKPKEKRPSEEFMAELQEHLLYGRIIVKGRRAIRVVTEEEMAEKRAELLKYEF